MHREARPRCGGSDRDGPFTTLLVCSGVCCHVGEIGHRVQPSVFGILAASGELTDQVGEVPVALWSTRMGAQD